MRASLDKQQLSTAASAALGQVAPPPVAEAPAAKTAAVYSADTYVPTPNPAARDEAQVQAAMARVRASFSSARPLVARKLDEMVQHRMGSIQRAYGESDAAFAQRLEQAEHVVTTSCKWRRASMELAARSKEDEAQFQKTFKGKVARQKARDDAYDAYQVQLDQLKYESKQTSARLTDEQRRDNQAEANAKVLKTRRL